MKLPRLTPSRIIRALIVIVAISALVYLLYDEPPPNDADLRLAPLNIPHDENAFTWFVEAGQKMPTDTEKDLDFFFGCDVKGDTTPWDAGRAEALLQKNAKAIDMVRMGLAFTRIEAQERERFGDNTPHLDQWRRLARVMSLRAIARAHAGNDREAMDAILDQIAFGHKVAKCRGGIIHYLIGVAIKQIGYRTLGEILPDIELPPDALIEYGSRLAPMAEGDEALANAFRADYMTTIQFTDDLMDGRRVVDGKRIPKQRLNFLFLRNATKRVHAEIHRTAIRNIGRRPDQYEVSQAKLESEKPHGVIPIPRRNMMGLMLAEFSAPSLDKVCGEGLSIRANDAMARLLIAIRCHHMKTGTLPASLNELVPEFIDAVPVDLLDGQPIRYDPAKKIIYSIGTDCEDNGGNEFTDTVMKIRFGPDTQPPANGDDSAPTGLAPVER